MKTTTFNGIDYEGGKIRHPAKEEHLSVPDRSFPDRKDLLARV